MLIRPEYQLIPQYPVKNKSAELLRWLVFVLLSLVLGTLLCKALPAEKSEPISMQLIKCSIPNFFIDQSFRDDYNLVGLQRRYFNTSIPDDPMGVADRATSTDHFVHKSISEIRGILTAGDSDSFVPTANTDHKKLTTKKNTCNQPIANSCKEVERRSHNYCNSDLTLARSVTGAVTDPTRQVNNVGSAFITAGKLVARGRPAAINAQGLFQNRMTARYIVAVKEILYNVYRL